MDIQKWLLDAWKLVSIDPNVLGAVTFGAMVASITGWFYLASAIHESRAHRAFEILSNVVLGGTALGVVVALGFNQGVSGACTGIALGCGLALGMDYAIPPRRGTVRFRIQRIASLVEVILFSTIYFTVHAILSIPLGIVVFLLWAISWVVTFPVFRMVSLLFHKRIRLDGAVAHFLGSPRSKSMPILLFSRMLPKSPTFLWILWTCYRLYRYVLLLVLGYLVAHAGAPLFTESARTQAVNDLWVAWIFGFGLLTGFAFFLIGLFDWGYFSLHDPNSIEGAAIAEEFEPLADMAGAAFEDETIDVQTIKQMIQYATDTDTSPQTSTTATEEAAKKEAERKLRAVSAKGTFLATSSLVVGLLTGLALGPIVGLSNTDQSVWIQRGIVFASSFAVTGLVGKPGLIVRGAAGAALLVVGAALLSLHLIVS